MAPVAVSSIEDKYDASQFQSAHQGKTKKGSFTVSEENKKQALYPEYLPTWNPNQKFPPYKFQEYHDKGLQGDKNYKNLFSQDKDYQVKRMTPKLGSVVEGIQLSQLDDAAKNDLARLISDRGVVVFKKQDFNSLGPEFAINFMKYFGTLHIHPTSGAPENFPQMHITFRGASQQEIDSVFKTRTNSILWHSDCSYSLNALQLTLFSCLQLPESGGDTLFANTVEAYERLSPAMQQRLEGLHILHSSVEQAEANKKAGGITRREPETNIHPIVRVNPTTGKKHLYVNKEFGRRIVELKQDESDYLLNFLYDHIERAQDLQIRVSWEPDTIVFWNNGTTVHTPCVDFDEPVIRHAYRISAMGERPVADVKYLNDPDYLSEKYKELNI
ncbi:Taurine catabolism dioxygenase TauD, TfdA family protein [Candida parapsilosis]|nr:Taurine catabolism dioxygenase TauD, TfdA family protein [Candida parapsilosis]KAF6042506.1 Taurine catabolism dioxygenase TauD, TfdA family protein [Candida parapsilosis]